MLDKMLEIPEEDSSENQGQALEQAPEMEQPVSETPTTEEAGQTGEDIKEYKPEGKDKNYLELEQKMTQQGQELSQYRKFYDEVSPVVEAIQNDEALLNNVLDRLYGDEGGAQSPAQTPEAPITPEVQQEKTEYSKDEVMKTVDQKLKSFEDQQVFERKVEKFIESHPDFNEKLPKILQVIDKHQINDDIELAYKLVEHDEMKAKMAELEEAKDEAKKRATNVGGASGGAKGDLPQSDSAWDYLAKPVNPNAAFGRFDDK